MHLFQIGILQYSIALPWPLKIFFPLFCLHSYNYINEQKKLDTYKPQLVLLF